MTCRNTGCAHTVDLLKVARDKNKRLEGLLEMVLRNEERAGQVGALDMYRHVCANIRMQMGPGRGQESV